MTAEREEARAGGVYLFSDEASARASETMHTARLEGFGISNIRSLSCSRRTSR